MKKYPEYKQLDLVQVAQEINEFWQNHDIFLESIKNREGKPSFTFYEGPPSANGEPGIHHVLSRALKDLFCRYKTLQGYQVKRKSGWDTHGLPVELQVEKSLGITKEEIGKKISIEEYNAHCRQTVMRYTDQWEKLTTELGYWLDTKNPYITYDRQYIESVWYLLKQLYSKGLLYKGYSIQPYSPAAGTGLSSHELNQPGCYRSVKDVTVVAQFKLKNAEQDYVLAWTTTPWTLPANSALAIGENITYVKVRTYNPYTHQLVQVILAEAALARYFTTSPDREAVVHYQPGASTIPWEIVAKYQGKDLVGLEYEQLLPYVQPVNHTFRIVSGDFVTTDEGTGIVHIAPTFGADDMRLAQKSNIPAITVERDGKAVPIVDKQGRFVEEITDWAGKYVKEDYETEDSRNQPGYKSADVLIAIKLKQENKAFHVAKYEHNYPHCWRTDKPILYYPLDAWFIRTTAYKDRLIALNKTINWKPASTGTGRFENWLENLVDWNLSRDRFWGTPLPIWRTEDGQEELCIGSIQELNEEVEKSIAAGFMEHQLPIDFDLHRPYVDNIVLVSKSGKEMHRTTDLIDVWFDSGAMPYAQWHYPFENKETFQQSFPADFIAEGVDQTRGWFFTLHAIAVMLFDSVAFKNVVSNGLILDKNGNKMSKRLGNSIDPFQIMQQHGPDALRWYMISNANPWDNLKFDTEGLVEVTRKFFSTLQNTYSFFALYANLDDFIFNVQSNIPLKGRPEIDRWILSRLHSLIQFVTTELDAYEPTRACRAIQDFVVDDLSNWYVRLNRKRFWKSEQTQDKTAAYQTLYTCLTTVAQLASPIAPFYTERLYKDLQLVQQEDKTSSIHLSDWPVVNTSAINLDLEAKMQQAQTIVSLVHSLRKKHNLKVRQPLTKLIVPVTNKAMQAQIEAVADLILAETNIKQITYIAHTSELVAKKVKPNFKQLGQRYKAQLKPITEALTNLTQGEINTLESYQAIDLHIGTETIKLTLDDVMIISEDIPGWSVASHEGITVALDITVTDALRQEGVARDVVNRVQNMRKSMGLEVQDKIQLAIASQEDFVKEAVTVYQAYICQETQALQFTVLDSLTEGEQVEIDNYVLRINVKLDTLNLPVF
ncbi:MAG: isoleucine--tRNA ligase [Candidatus Amoebophilus sp.]